MKEDDTSGTKIKGNYRILSDIHMSDDSLPVRA